jgi:hypothetical protein
MHPRTLVIACAVAALAALAPLQAAPKVVPASTLGPHCVKLIAEVFAKVAPGELPVTLLPTPAPKVGPYVAPTESGKMGGVKVTTVLTGAIEYQDGASRNIAPVFCIGNAKEAGYYYASRPSATLEDRPIAPVQTCYARAKGDAAAARACIVDTLVKSEGELTSAVAHAKVRATQAGGEELKNLEASEREFQVYRTRSCETFKAPDASTDAQDFYDGCLARLNTMRANKLNAPPAPAPPAPPPSSNR